jgi:DNA polymerase IV
VSSRELARYILHVDADAFFASVEQVLRPELRGVPVVVAGGDRGVVSAASYEARRFGVHSAMPTVQARKLCPRAVFLAPNFEAYRTFSQRMFAIMKEFSPVVEVTSVDEGYMDLTGTLRLHRASPWEVAHRILSRIRCELGINASGAVAGTKSQAKMATSLAKPNGLLYLEPHFAGKILGALPVDRIPGVGPRAAQVLESQGITTVEDLATASTGTIRRLLGRWGEVLVETASGIDPRPVVGSGKGDRKSYSRDRTLEKDTSDVCFVRHVVVELTEKLAARLRKDGKGATTVTVKVRYADFTDVSKSQSLQSCTNLTGDLTDCATALLKKAVIPRVAIRQVGVRFSGIDVPLLQTDLFDPTRPRRAARDRMVDEIRNRYGFDAISAGHENSSRTNPYR